MHVVGAARFLRTIADNFWEILCSCGWNTEEPAANDHGKQMRSVWDMIEENEPVKSIRAGVGAGDERNHNLISHIPLFLLQKFLSPEPYPPRVSYRIPTAIILFWKAVDRTASGKLDSTRPKLKTTIPQRIKCTRSPRRNGARTERALSSPWQVNLGPPKPHFEEGYICSTADL